jgi:AcrR family transcriptional regulator
MSRQERRTQLLDVAEALFVEDGFSAVSIEAIARVADVTRPVVYEHFGTKEGVFLACVARAMSEYQEGLLEEIDPTADRKEHLVAAARSFFTLLDERPGRWHLMFGSTAALPGPFAEQLADLRFSMIELVRTGITAKSDGVSSERIEAAAHAVSGIGERLGLWWLRNPGISREQMVAHYVAIAWAGLDPLVPDA